jgi:hypothetical protein
MWALPLRRLSFREQIDRAYAAAPIREPTMSDAKQSYQDPRANTPPDGMVWQDYAMGGGQWIKPPIVRLPDDVAKRMADAEKSGDMVKILAVSVELLHRGMELIGEATRQQDARIAALEAALARSAK